MKTLSILAGAIFGIAAAGLVFSAYSESSPNADKQEQAETQTSQQPGASGCCGKCAMEELVEGDKTGCCVNRKEQTAEEKDGCCGKCSQYSASKTKTSCDGECNQSAGGVTAETATKKPVETNDEKAKLPDEHVNSMREDRELFHFLLRNHDKITRTVTDLDNGVRTVTESSDATVAATIQKHVASMHRRVKDVRPLRMWDDLYREIFKHADKIQMKIENTDNGISVTETSDDPYVVKLIQSHADVVTGFTKRGFDEARKNHKPPKSKN